MPTGPNPVRCRGCLPGCRPSKCEDTRPRSVAPDLPSQRMTMETTLLHELPLASAHRTPDASALSDDRLRLSYAQLAAEITRFAGAMAALGVARGARVAVYLDKRVETVVASFGAPAHGAVFVPINPLLKPEQVGYIL